MAAQFGINVSRTGEDELQEIAALGAQWVRLVAIDQDRLATSHYIQRCHAAGLSVLMLIARESLAVDGQSEKGIMSYDVAAQRYRERYIDNTDPSGNVDAWQIGNEPDGTGSSSWSMSQEELSKLIGAFREAWPAAKLLAPGLISGHADWLDRVNLSGLHAVAFHPYGKNVPGFRSPYQEHDEPTVQQLIGDFRRFGLPIWVTEFGVKAADMPETPDTPGVVLESRYLNRMLGYLGKAEPVEVVFQYRWRSRSNPSFSLVDEEGNKTPSWEGFEKAISGEAL